MNGTWVIGYRPFAKPTPTYTIYQLQAVGGRLTPCYVQDARSGTDALYPTKEAAKQALRAIKRAPLQVSA